MSTPSPRAPDPPRSQVATAQPERVRRAFTGERLHAEGPRSDRGGGPDLFAVDLARHRAAYRHAAETWRTRVVPEQEPGRLLDLGCGAGYGTALLADSLVDLDTLVLGYDRALPDRASRGGGARFVCGEVEALPFAAASCDLVASFQVIEHLENPESYLREVARVLSPDGLLMLTTPNRETSDGLNPYHLHEYLAEELERLLSRTFAIVRMQGVGRSGRVAPYVDARRRSLARIERLDVLRLRQRLPRPLRLWLFARAAILMRLALRRRGTLVEAGVEDFPIVPIGPTTLDLLAVCARPRG